MRNLLPPFIQQQYRQGVFSGQMQAASLFADISGFTRMTDTLLRHGKDGVETLSEILNHVFTPTVQSIYACGGFIATYAGDAFTAVFPVQETPQEAAQRAFCAAQEIIEFFQKSGAYDSALGRFEFSAKVGLGFGAVDWGILGDEISRVFYFRGAAIDGCAQAEHYAEAGEIWAAPDFLAQMPALAYSKNLAQGGFAPVKNAPRLQMPHRKVEAPVFNEQETRLFGGTREFDFPEGEFREVVTVFIAFEGLPDLAAFVHAALKLQRQYGGSHLRLDFGDKGGNILVLFGAPVAYENKEERALQFLAELWRQVSTPAKIKAGMTCGMVYAGFYGSDLQKTFSALGSVTNQAARFMVRAEWGQALCDEGLSKTPGHEFSYLGDFSYKGRAQTIPTYALQRMETLRFQARPVPAENRSALLVGREQELHFLRDALAPLQKGQFGGVLYVDGGPGLGKSRLLQAFRQETPQFQWFFLPCDEVLRKSLNPLVYFLQEYFQQNAAASLEENRRRFETRFNQLFQQTRHFTLKRGLKSGRAFLAALLQLTEEDTLIRQYDAQARYENTLDALKNLLKAESARQPLILHLEDAHWIDPDSREFFRRLMRNVQDSPFLVLAACRYQDDGSPFTLTLDDETPQQRLALAPLSRADAEKIISFTLQSASAPVPPTTLTFIHQRCDGNPFFIEQTSLYLKENHLIDEQNHLDPRLASGEASLEIPSTINAILVARIDRLTTDVKEIVKTASTLGQEFATIILSAMLRKMSLVSEDALHSSLDAGEKQAIWQSISELRYIFKHALIRDAAYGMQLKKHLRALHKLAAESIEELFQADLKPYYANLADHYEKAGISQSAVRYLRLAAQTALNEYRNQEAAAFYERLLRYPLPPEEELQAWENKGKAERQFGDWEAAKQTFTRMLRRAKALHAPIWQAKAANALAYLLLAHGQVKQGFSLAKQAQALALQTGDLPQQVQSLKNLGMAAGIRGEREQARQIHTEMLALAKEIDDLPSITSALFQLREYLLSEGGLLAEFEQYLRRAEEKNDLRLMASLFFYIGDVHLMQHNYLAAEQVNRRMYEVVQTLGDKQGMCYAIGDRGIVLAELGRFEEAAECYREKLVLAREIGDGYNLWEGLFNSGALYSLQQNHAQSAEFLREAAHIARKYGLQSELALTLLEQAENSLAQNDLQTAQKFLAEAGALNSLLKDEDFTRKSRLLNAKLHKDARPLDDLLASASKEEERADLLFERWRMTNADSDRQQAQAVYQTLYDQSPRYLYSSRLQALQEKT